MRIFLCLFLFVQIIPPALAKKRFEWTPALRSAYDKTLSLRFVEAEAELATIRRNDPSNLLVLHVENYLDCFRVIINEDITEFERLEKNKEIRLKAIENEGDKLSPYYLYLQANIRLHWAVARVKFDEYSTAFFETNKAHKLLTTNAEKFPKFMPNKKDLGLLHAIVGTIPDNYKWTVSLLSNLEGTIQQGRAEMEEVMDFANNHDFFYEKEIHVFYAYFLNHLANESEKAWEIINKTNLKPTENPIDCFLKATFAMRSYRGDEANNILNARPTGKQFHPFYYLDYLHGLVKLQQLENGADVYFKRYVDNYKGRSFIKDAYRKLAWHALLFGDTQEYKKFMNLCKSKGYAIIGSDKSAMEEAKSGDMPAVELLKARLLFDGGHFQKAYDVLKEKNASDYLSAENRLEYYYRLGRISHKMKSYKDALQYYQVTIDKGVDSPTYFACRSALEKGHILEEQGRNKQAKESYKLCLSMSPEDHKIVLHQQAKAGLQRLKS